MLAGRVSFLKNMQSSNLTPVWRQWAVLRLLPVALLAELATVALNFFAVPAYLREDLGLPERVVGIVIAAYLVSEALLKGVVGHYADRFGRKRFLVIGPLIWFVTPLLTVMIPAGWGNGVVVAVVLLRVVDGLAAAMVWTSAYAMMGDATCENQRSQGMSLLNLCFMTGLALGFLAGGEANAAFDSYSAAFVAASTLFGLTAILVVATVPDDHMRRDGHEEEHRLRDILLCFRQVPLTLTVGFITFFGVGLPAPIVMFFAQDVYGVPVNEFGRTLVLPAGFLMGALSLPMGTLGERIGHARAVRLGLWFCAVGLWMISAGNWIEWTRSLAMTALAAGTVGIGFLLALPAWYAFVSRINPARSGLYIGAVMAVQGIGAILGTLVGSRLYENNPFYPGIGAAIAISIGFVLAHFAARRSPDANPG